MRPARAIDHRVDQRELHRDARIFGAAFAPGLGEIALEKPRSREAIDDAATRVAGQFLAEIADHLRRRETDANGRDPRR